MTEIYYWMGQPISEIPRKELEQLFLEARKEIDDMNGRWLTAKTAHIRDLAAVRKRYG